MLQPLSNQPRSDFSRGKRKKWFKKNGEISDELYAIMQDVGTHYRIRCLCFPGLARIKIFIPEPHKLKNIVKSILKLSVFYFPIYWVESCDDPPIYFTIDLSFRHNAPLIFSDKSKCSVHEIAVGTKQLAIIALDELPPRKVSIPLFRTIGYQEISQGVWIILINYILGPDSPVLAGWDLSSLEGQILARDDVVRQAEPTRMLFIVKHLSCCHLWFSGTSWV